VHVSLARRHKADLKVGGVKERREERAPMISEGNVRLQSARTSTIETE
jgi:hypothetical protein